MDLWTRRDFSALMGLAGLSALVPGAGTLAQPFTPGQKTTFFEWKRLNKHAWAGFGAGGNVLVIQSDEAALLVDTKNGGFGPLLRQEAERLGRPIKVVLNTHHHADHTGGNTTFTGDVRVIAHKNAIQRIRDQFDRYKLQAEGAIGELVKSEASDARASAETVEAMLSNWEELRGQFIPTVSMDLEQQVSEFGLKAELRHRGDGHTDNDVFLVDSTHNILHTGDLVFHRNHPYIDLGAGATIDGWIKSLERMIEFCDESTTVVPGHGEICDVDGIKEQIEYFVTMRRIVTHAKNVEGMSRAEVEKMTPSQFKDYGFKRLEKMNLGIVWDQV